MAARFDVTARLAEGRPAVEHTQTYVRACHVLGYQHPDLTAYDSQVCDWYDAETGLDLRVLDDDSVTLTAAVNVIEEALHLQRAQLAELTAAWSGSGADSAARFLQRHCDVAAEVAAHLRAAADGCATLRDNLWEIVDGKAATAIAIDDRRLGEQSAWLAAAHTVMTGAGDRVAAEQLIHRQVNPYVDNDIRGDWLTGMRSAAASVAASYDVTIRALTSTPEVCFEIPGELGPSWQSASVEPPGPSSAAGVVPEVSLPAERASTVPAAASSQLPPAIAVPPTPSADALEDSSSGPAEQPAPLGDATGLPSNAGNLGGFDGLVGKIVDSIGGLLGSLIDGFDNAVGEGDSPLDSSSDGSSDADDPLVDEGEQADDEVGELPVAGVPACEGASDDTGIPPACGEAVGADEDVTRAMVGESSPAAGDSVDEPPPTAASPVALPPDKAPPSASEPQSEEATPCEIAADELPQAGR
jgi:hypothetical protein